jgi:dTDP-4-dehydrorhamnose 3,5-epimerase-like enzyme
MEIELIPGGSHTDERGTVSFVNDFDFKWVGRFYTIRSHRCGDPRGWIGHQIEQKWFAALSGSVLVVAVKIDDWESPSPTLPVQRYTLSSATPAVLQVPPGHVCAMVMLTDDALLGVFSSGKIEDTSYSKLYGLCEPGCVA